MDNVTRAESPLRRAGANTRSEKFPLEKECI